MGAQKCGTSWLYEHVASHPDARFPQSKELHVFDTALQPKLFGHFARDTTRRLLRQLEKNTRPRDGVITLRPPLPELRAIAAAQIDIARYPQIFTETGTAQLTGDITPSYAGLSAADFARIRGIIQAAGAQVRVVFLMRDPVERAYSAARMWARSKEIQDPQQIFAHLSRRLAAPAYMVRGRYDQTIEALEDAFAPEELYFGFYETLFTPTSVKRLSRFLGLPPHPADFEHRVNTTVSAGPLPDRLAATAREVYDPVYRFCQARFGAELPDGWHI